MAPDGIFGDENFRARMFEELPLLGGGEFIVKRDEDSTAIKNGEGRDQPLGLVGHDDAGAVGGGEAGVLNGAGEWESAGFEFAVGEAVFFAFAVGLDETDFFGEPIDGVF